MPDLYTNGTDNSRDFTVQRYKDKKEGKCIRSNKYFIYPFVDQ
jgi:hypothetical protein